MYILSIKKNRLAPEVIIPYMTKMAAMIHKKRLEEERFKYYHVGIKRVETMSELDCMEEI